MNACVRALCLFILFVSMPLGISGCVKSKVTVFVNPDGSGHLVISRLFNRQTVEMLDMQRQQMGMDEMPDGEGMEEMKARRKVDPFYDEKVLQKEAKSYGSGLKLVKSRRIDMDGGRGSIAVYSFKDINDVFLGTDVSRFQSMLHGGGMPDMDEGDDGDDDGGRGRRGKAGVEFSFQTGVVSNLKILLPAFDASEDDVGQSPAEDQDLVDDGEDGEDGEDVDYSGMGCDEMMEWFDPGMMSYSMPVGFNYRYAERYAGNAMLQGMSVGVEIAINGKIVTSSASHTNAANPGRLVLLDVDSSRRDKKDVKPGRNNDLYNFYDFNRFMNGLTKVPGTVVETNREVVVSFK